MVLDVSSPKTGELLAVTLVLVLAPAAVEIAMLGDCDASCSRLELQRREGDLAGESPQAPLAESRRIVLRRRKSLNVRASSLFGSLGALLAALSSAEGFGAVELRVWKKDGSRAGCLASSACARVCTRASAVVVFDACRILYRLMRRMRLSMSWK